MKKRFGLVAISLVLIVCGAFATWQGMYAGPHGDCKRVMGKVNSGSWRLTDNLLIAVPLGELSSIIDSGNWRSALQQFMGKDVNYGYFSLMGKCQTMSFANGYMPVKNWGIGLPRVPAPKQFALPTPSRSRLNGQFPLVAIAALGILAFFVRSLFRRRYVTAS